MIQDSAVSCHGPALGPTPFRGLLRNNDQLTVHYPLCDVSYLRKFVIYLANLASSFSQHVSCLSLDNTAQSRAVHQGEGG